MDTSSTSVDTVVLHQWIARKIRPVIAFGVVLVFLAFMTLAYFIFHSPEAVKALGMAALGSLGGVIASILTRSEFRLTHDGLDKRPYREKDPKEFETVFRWDELDHVVTTRNGFKFYKPISDTRAVGRWWKKWFSDAFSGEVQVESIDRETVGNILRERFGSSF